VVVKKRKYIKKRPKTKLIEKAEAILFQILLYKRGERCEICGGPPIKLGLFHILPKGRYPRIRFHKDNLLLACWFKCHFPWHHSYYHARDIILPKIKELRGDDFEDRLRKVDATSPPVSVEYLSMLILALEKELESLDTKWQHRADIGLLEGKSNVDF